MFFTRSRALHSSRISDKATSDIEDSIRLCSANFPHLLGVIGISTPSYDRADVRPGVVNIGLRNFHRVHNAVFFDSLLRLPGNKSWGMISVAMNERQRRACNELKVQDSLYTVVAKNGQGLSDLRVIGSILDVMQAPDDCLSVSDLISKNETRMVTLTIKESKYHFDRDFQKLDETHPDIVYDLLSGTFSRPFRTPAGLLVSGLYQRYLNKGHPITILSCDNLIRNGEMTRKMVETFALHKFPLKPGFHRWLSANVFYPNTMCDRICLTDPSGDRIGLQQEFGVRDNALLTTESHNEWVIEKWMGNKPEGLEEVGIKMVPSTIPYENLKVRLNYGCRLCVAMVASAMGIPDFEAAMQRSHLSSFADSYMNEVSNALGDTPKGMDLDAYKRNVKVRIATPQLKYSTARVVEDASKKIVVDWKPILESLVPTGKTSPSIAFALSAWIHLLGGSSIVNPQQSNISIPDCDMHILDSASKKIIGSVDHVSENIPVNEFLHLVFGPESHFVPLLGESIVHALKDINKLGIEGSLKKRQSESQF